MRLIAFGADARMKGAVLAARRAGWEAVQIRSGQEAQQLPSGAHAVMLPWPVSFREERLTGTDLTKERVLALIPPCRMIVYGAGVEADELVQAQRWLNPGKDEAFLRCNAQLTAEGAICRAMGKEGRALMGSTVVVTGFGRIGQALTQRLTALGAFVIVCARNEIQMQRAHEMGAHPMTLLRLREAAAQADVIFNTVPSGILSESILDAIDTQTLIIELASAPYGMDIKLAREKGLSVTVENGLPGRYAPLDAGAAVFDALQRAIEQTGVDAGRKTDG
ncbi:MAG: NAD(P)-binding domain-containing protein [Clostridia bacterium]|nr:NAD(P)-binding domain-containing protein [Clostridia bacterium]